MKISVIIPAHNEESVIKRAVKSVLSSSFKDFEVIVVDNGSNDKTSIAAKSFNDKRVKVFYYDKKRGPAAARNYGVIKARGDFVFFLDADDWLGKNTLLNLSKALSEHPDINAVIAYRLPVSPKGLSVVWSYEFINNYHIGNKVVTEGYHSCPYVFRKSFFKKLGGFDVSTYYFEDDVLRQKILDLGIPVLLSEDSVYYSDMGSSFSDFFKRAKNIGRGIAKSRDYYRLIRILVMSLFFIYSFLNPLIFLLYYLIFSSYWLFRSKNFIVSFTAPFLFILKKFISLFYVFK